MFVDLSSERPRDTRPIRRKTRVENRPGLPFPAMQVFVMPRKIEGQCESVEAEVQVAGNL